MSDPVSSEKNGTSMHLVPVSGDQRHTKLLVPSKVLVEEDYLKLLNYLLERNFFPDLPKLRIMKDYVECLLNGDENRARGLLTFLRSSQTPTIVADHIGHKYLRSENMSVRSFLESNHEGKALVTLLSGKECSVALDMTLSQFFQNFISQDNASFSRLIHTEKQEYGVNKSNGKNLSITDSTKQKLKLKDRSNPWTKVQNSLALKDESSNIRDLMSSEAKQNVPSSLTLAIHNQNQAAAAALRKGKLDVRNTRFTSSQEIQLEETSKRKKFLREAQEAAAATQIAEDAGELIKDSHGDEEMFSSLLISPDKAVEELGDDLLMSWGEVVSSQSNGIDFNSDFKGNPFQIQETGEREKIARDLLDRMQRRQLQRKGLTGTSTVSAMSGMDRRNEWRRGSEMLSDLRSVMSNKSFGMDRRNVYYGPSEEGVLRKRQAGKAILEELNSKNPYVGEALENAKNPSLNSAAFPSNLTVFKVERTE